jgi:hypothetical protein
VFEKRRSACGRTSSFRVQGGNVGNRRTRVARRRAPRPETGGPTAPIKKGAVPLSCSGAGNPIPLASESGASQGNGGSERRAALLGYRQRRFRSRGRLPEFEEIAGDPYAVHDHRKLARRGDRRPLHAATLGDIETPGPRRDHLRVRVTMPMPPRGGDAASFNRRPYRFLPTCRSRGMQNAHARLLVGRFTPDRP